MVKDYTLDVFAKDQLYFEGQNPNDKEDEKEDENEDEKKLPEGIEKYDMKD